MRTTIDHDQVENVLSMAKAIELSRVAFRLQTEGKLVQPLRGILDGGDDGLLGTMPVLVNEGDYKGFSIKSVLVRFDPIGKHASHSGVVLVYDEPEVGVVSSVDAGAITAIRTAAASAYATDLLASQQPCTIAILGTGLQARTHLQAVSHVREIVRVNIWGRTPARVDEFVAWASKEFDVPIVKSTSVREAAEEATVICATTASASPILSRADLPEAVHVNAIGASTPAFQELSADVFQDATLFTDSNEAVLAASAAVQQAVEAGYLKKPDVGTEVGSILSTRWNEADGTTVFKSVGLAVQDAVTARYVVRESNS